MLALILKGFWCSSAPVLPFLSNKQLTQYYKRKRRLSFLLNDLTKALTGKFLSESLIFASTNPRYDDRLFIDLRVPYMKVASSEHVVYTNCFFVFVFTFKTIYVSNMFSPCSELGIFMY